MTPAGRRLRSLSFCPSAKAMGTGPPSAWVSPSPSPVTATTMSNTGTSADEMMTAAAPRAKFQVMWIPPSSFRCMSPCRLWFPPRVIRGCLQLLNVAYQSHRSIPARSGLPRSFGDDFQSLRTIPAVLGVPRSDGVACGRPFTVKTHYGPSPLGQGCQLQIELTLIGRGSIPASSGLPLAEWLTPP